MTTPFDHLRDYKLLKGSHEFPGQEGGACLNEVAIVVAGLDYRVITSAHDCPPCFSRPIAAFAIGLNDLLATPQRQDLKRFVHRMAGSADAPGVELSRGEHFVMKAICSALPRATRFTGRKAATLALEKVSSPKEAIDAAIRLRYDVSGPAWLLDALLYASQSLHHLATGHRALASMSSGMLLDLNLAQNVVGLATDAASMAFLSMAHAAHHTDLSVAVDALDSALAIGRQAPPPPDPSIVTERLAKVLRPTVGAFA